MNIETRIKIKCIEPAKLFNLNFSSPMVQVLELILIDHQIFMRHKTIPLWTYSRLRQTLNKYILH